LHGRGVAILGLRRCTRVASPVGLAALGALSCALLLPSQVAGRPAALGATTATCRKAERQLAAYTPTLRTYDDPIEDSASAPDFCSGEIVTNDNETITIGIYAHNRAGFESGDTYSVFLDTDLNPGTGGGGYGAEYEITFDGAGAATIPWNGSSFDSASASPASTEWQEGYGPVFEIARGAIGGALGFTFVLVSANGPDGDRAPDNGSWAYTLTPLVLEMGAPSLGLAKAGRSFSARTLVMRSDLDSPLAEGAIGCTGRLAGRPLQGKGRFADDHLICAWPLPRTGRGKQFSGRIAVTFQGAVTGRTFTVRVR
jgi:hypothetical protein